MGIRVQINTHKQVPGYKISYPSIHFCLLIINFDLSMLQGCWPAVELTGSNPDINILKFSICNGQRYLNKCMLRLSGSASLMKLAQPNEAWLIFIRQSIQPSVQYFLPQDTKHDIIDWSCIVTSIYTKVYINSWYKHYILFDIYRFTHWPTCEFTLATQSLSR